MATDTDGAAARDGHVCLERVERAPIVVPSPQVPADETPLPLPTYSGAQGTLPTLAANHDHGSEVNDGDAWAVLFKRRQEERQAWNRRLVGNRGKAKAVPATQAPVVNADDAPLMPVTHRDYGFPG
jgi:hypothetical protein